MRNRPFTLARGFLHLLAMADLAAAEAHGVRQRRAQQPFARQQPPHIHEPPSIDDELAPLTKDLEWTPEQQKQVRLLLEEHHDKIRALLTDRQEELEKAMQQHERHGGENRRFRPPVAASPGPSSRPLDI
ncbi:MAG TPA: hypothetical protein VGP19_13260 [Candidatus Acidoferrales bacterium]|nr:hypothetical protein [Candidatus Acidoferrales bacterium]